MRVFDRGVAPDCLSPTLTFRGSGDKKRGDRNVYPTASLSNRSGGELLGRDLAHRIVDSGTSTDSFGSVVWRARRDTV